MGLRESYTPWMRSLLNTMKEKYGKPDAKTIAEALPDVGEGSGGEVTPSSVAYAISHMSDAQAAQALADLGYTVDSSLNDESENPVQNMAITGQLAIIALALANKANKQTVAVVDGTTPTIVPEGNHEYKCRTLDSLVISNSPISGIYSVVFTSGSTPTDLSIDPAIKMPDGFSVDANRIYEINVLDNRATVKSWAVTP